MLFALLAPPTPTRFLDLPTVLLCTSSTYTLHHSPLSLFSEILFHPLTELRLGTWTKTVIEFDLWFSQLGCFNISFTYHSNKCCYLTFNWNIEQKRIDGQPRPGPESQVNWTIKSCNRDLGSWNHISKVIGHIWDIIVYSQLNFMPENSRNATFPSEIKTEKKCR